MYTDLSTVFVQLTDIDPHTQTAVNMFINFIDERTGLPMGTIQPFGVGDNRLYTYDPLNDVNDPPPTVRDLLTLYNYVQYTYVNTHKLCIRTYVHVLNFTVL